MVCLFARKGFKLWILHGFCFRQAQKAFDALLKLKSLQAIGQGQGQSSQAYALLQLDLLTVCLKIQNFLM
jgi:hypothetical protein